MLISSKRSALKKSFIRVISDFSPDANKQKSQKEIDTELHEYHMMQGHMAFNADNWDVSLEHYIKANRHNSRTSLPVSGCAAIYEKKGEHDNLLAASRLAIKMAKKSKEDPQLISNEFQRLGRTYIELKNYQEAQKAFSEAYLYTYNDYSLEKLNEVEQKLKVEIQIKKFLPEDKAKQSTYYEEITKDLPVRIDFGGVGGRGLFSEKDFKQGEVVFSEAPIVACVDYLNSEKDFCIGTLHPLRKPEIKIPKPLEEVLKACGVDYMDIIQSNIESNHNVLATKPKKCNNCNLKFVKEEMEGVTRNEWLSSLCSGSCSADSRLKILLPSFFDPLYGCFDSKEVIPLYRDIASLELLTLVIVKISKNEDLWDRFFKFLIYASKIPDRLLLDHEMLHYTTLKEMFPSLSWLLTEKNYLRMKELVNMNAFTISTNCVNFDVESKNNDIENIQLEVKPTVSEKEVRCNALFKAGSFFNHSCDPNVEIARPSWSSHVTWVAVRDIKEGDELLCAYIPEIKGENGDFERKNLLYEQYGFVCEGSCELCQIEKADKVLKEKEEEYKENHNNIE